MLGLRLIKNHIHIFSFSFLYFTFLIYVHYNSPELFWADDLYHLEQSFLLSQGDLRYAVDGWTRPLFAIPCAIMIKIFGYKMMACRLISISSASVSLLILYFITFHFTKSRIISFFVVSSLAIIPISIQIAVSTLSQMLFQLVLLLGIYTFVKKRYYLSSFLIGLLPLIRAEGLILIILWIFNCLLSIKERKIISFCFLLSIIPSLIWSISSYFIRENLFPQIVYPFHSPYPPLPFLTYLKNLIKEIGMASIFAFSFGTYIVIKYGTKELKFLLEIVIVVITFHLLIAHFGLGGSMGAVEYLTPFFPIIILLGYFSLHYITKKYNVGNIGLVIMCFLLFIINFGEFYISKKYENAISRPYRENTLDLFDLSRYFYYNISYKNESVQFCGAQVLKNFEDSGLEIPIQIRFQHNPSNEMSEICPNCFYSNKFSGAKWVIWHRGWCNKIVNGRFVEVAPEELLNESYHLVFERAYVKVYKLRSLT
jgi:hypothetical protein